MAKVTMEPTAVSSTPEVPVIPPTNYAGVLKQLTLDQITLDPNTDVRTGPKSKEDAEKIDLLAKSIYTDGQLQPILVRPNSKEGHYYLIAGRRRYAAKQIIAEKTKEPVTIDAVVVEATDEQAWLSSIQENLQRKQFSPIEIAQNIVDIRKRKGWNGKDWTDKVAVFLHVSRATVSQHAKLLSLPADLRKKVHSGDLGVQAAIDILAVEESKRDEVFAKAEQLAEAEVAEKQANAKTAKVGKGGKAVSDEPTPTSAPKKAISEEVEKGKVKRKHVLEAARQSEALTQAKPRTRGEIMDFFQNVLDSTDPYPDPIVAFCQTFTGKWATGQVGDRALLNKLDAISELCGDAAKKSAKKKA
jgi:ParB/RepB/Spo0J family partition protein